MESTFVTKNCIKSIRKINLVASQIVLAFLIYSCGYVRTDKPINSNKESDSISYVDTGIAPEELTTIRLYEGMKPLYDTLSFDNLIENVKLVPLETTSNSLVNAGSPIKVNDHYIMLGGNPITPYVKAFNSLGEFVGDSYTPGRGPNETTMVYSVSGDNRNNRITLFGPGKILFHDLTTYETTGINIDDYNPFYNPVWLTNGNLVVSVLDEKTQSLSGEQKRPEKRPVLYFLNSDMTVTDTIFTTEPVHRIIEGGTVGQIMKNQLVSNGDRVLFKYMLNDTIYRVNNNHVLTPAFILDIAKNLKPSLKNSEMDQIGKKNKMIYIVDFYESKDYIFITYDYKGLSNFGIWNKHSGELVVHHNSFYIDAFYASFDGITTELFTEQIDWETNTIYTSVDASKMVGILPNIKPEDNPIVVELKLKSR